MGKVTVEDGNKTVFRYDASARTFKKAALLLFTLASGMIIVAIIWFANFKGIQ
jgi:hypothetical protein|tara:strand:+ start:5749 stop:5907 length:159 start_codon:yes stop_codon:yes gene_type:complete